MAASAAPSLGIVVPSAMACLAGVVLQPTPDEPDLEGYVRFVAEEVRPLVTEPARTLR